MERSVELKCVSVKIRVHTYVATESKLQRWHFFWLNLFLFFLRRAEHVVKSFQAHNALVF